MRKKVDVIVEVGIADLDTLRDEEVDDRENQHQYDRLVDIDLCNLDLNQLSATVRMGEIVEVRKK